MGLSNMKNTNFQSEFSRSLFILLIIFTSLLTFPLSAEIETPKQFFGFQPGADRMLFDYEQLIDYFSSLSNKSPRLDLREIGMSARVRKMYCLFISSSTNIVKLENIRQTLRLMKSTSSRILMSPDRFDTIWPIKDPKSLRLNSYDTEEMQKEMDKSRKEELEREK